jgi:hypothetical protein
MPRRCAIVSESRTGRQEADMECADWLEGGFDSAQARFLMVTAITHHRFRSPAWGEHEIRRLYAELTEIDVSAAQVLGSSRGPRAWNRRPAARPGFSEQEVF